MNETFECDNCEKEINRSEPYYSVVLNKEKQVDGKESIEVIESEELQKYCSEACLDECIPIVDEE